MQIVPIFRAGCMVSRKGVFWNAFLRLEIHRNQAETIAVALFPFKIANQRSLGIFRNIHSIFCRPARLQDMMARIILTGVHLFVQTYPIKA